MKIGFLAPFNPVPAEGTTKGGHMGGVERYSDCLTRALARRGHEVTIVCSGEEERTTLLAGVKIVQKKRRALVMRTPIANLQAETLRDMDVVHIPATYPSYSEILPVLARLKGIPCVMDYHFDVPPFGLGAKILAPVYYAIAKHSFALNSAIILKNEGYEQTSPGLRSLRPEIFEVIPNGVDTDFYRATEAPSRDYFLFVGRLVPFKGVDVLIRAMAAVPVAERIRLVIAGSGPERETLETLAASLGVECEFKGFVSNEELLSLYQNARATILPSVTHQESFGMTMIESMSCGTPVIASELPGTRYVTRFGGRNFPAGDAAALSNILRFTAASETQLQGPELSRRIEAEYSWDSVAARIEALYVRVAAERREASARKEIAQNAKA